MKLEKLAANGALVRWSLDLDKSILVMTTQELLRELDEINRSLAYIHEDITERGYPTHEEVKRRRELNQRSVDLSAQIPVNIDNKS